MSMGTLKPATTYPMVVGKVLGYLRDQKGLGQKDLADAMGVTQPTLSRIENGQSALTVDQLALAASILKVSSDQILTMVDRSVESLKKQGVKVEHKKPSEEISPGLVLIGAAALAALLIVIFSKSKG